MEDAEIKEQMEILLELLPEFFDFLENLGCNNTKSGFSKSGLDIGGAFMFIGREAELQFVNYIGN